MNAMDIPWRLPWRALQFKAEIPAVQCQFEKEVTARHKLWGKEGRVAGRRVET
jgi:hypothetical protein